MITAILVDDSAFLKGLLKSILSRHNVKVVGEAHDGKQGMEMYKELRPDVVFMDVMMDTMNGIEALHEIREFDPDAIVVMASSMMEQKPFVDEVAAQGAIACINKPFDEKEVATAMAMINRILRDRKKSKG